MTLQNFCEFMRIFKFSIDSMQELKKEFTFALSVNQGKTFL